MRRYVAEAVGTFGVVFAGCGAAAVGAGRLGDTGVALAFGLALALVAFAGWQSWLFYLNATPFGARDPILGHDASFYVFELPFLQLVQRLLLGLLGLAALGVGIQHALAGNLALDASRGVFATLGAKRHLSLLAAGLLLVLALGAWLRIPELLITRSGIVHGAEFLDLAEEDFDRVLRINLKGAFLCGQAAARQMVSQEPRARGERGVIINMSSVNAVLAIPNQVPYVVSKGALNQLTKVMALSLASQGVRVVAIGPGSIATELLKTAVLGNEAARARIMSRTPLGRLGEPEEVARVVGKVLDRPRQVTAVPAWRGVETRLADAVPDLSLKALHLFTAQGRRHQRKLLRRGAPQR